jgi:hypothetical protein
MFYKYNCLNNNKFQFLYKNRKVVNYNDILTTTISYWNKSCRKFFYIFKEINEKFNTFISKLNSYNPRKFVLDNLSIDICEQKLIDLVINNYL